MWNLKSGKSVVSGQRRGFLAAAAAAFLLAACDMPMGPGAAGPSVDTRRPVTVALLVPGGTNDQGRQVLAQSLENAARLAVADLQGVQIDLRVYQTGGNSQRAAQMAAQAVNDGAGIIVGPLFADSATAVGRTVAGSGVNVLSFSNNPSAAGGNVFLLGPTFENTATRLMSYAASQGKGRVMLISEQNQSGQVAEAAVRAAAARSGASLVATQSYAFSQQGVVDALPRISAAARSSGAQTVLMTAGSEGALPILAELLPQNGLSRQQFQYMGLTRWDIPAATLQLRGIDGGWFAMPDPALTSQFEARYAAAYGDAPHPVANLGYDGIAAVGALLRQGGADALSAARLTQGQGFAGVSGVFRLRRDGMNERGLAVAEVRDGSTVIISPAPRSFTGGGF
ncbi:penicillin-binding protein activator [Roseinatronobacter alkalisoli]|uniref:Penicillin-binding protein activator n=1 Tax=Roseinatronobacter alkalisoli TaxID=3028235 RepID=A0ABT5T646_9RHOB|nr:penicillin-binding protein activator [Roseinatronobacter sp. HJB301]MDD7970573.1 penicillin-binding protein activator [Roseinatronobacter sp. HJB301]